MCAQAVRLAHCSVTMLRCCLPRVTSVAALRFASGWKSEDCDVGVLRWDGGCGRACVLCPLFSAPIACAGVPPSDACGGPALGDYRGPSQHCQAARDGVRLPAAIANCSKNRDAAGKFNRGQIVAGDCVPAAKRLRSAGWGDRDGLTLQLRLRDSQGSRKWPFYRVPTCM